MSFKKSWDEADIYRQIYAMARECASPHNTGFLTFEIKKDLYLIKEIVDQALKDSPNFGNLENDWLKDQEQKRILKILKS